MLKLFNFIERANKIHNNKYDYSKVVYNGINSKVTIICPTHKEFNQVPYAHLRGQGCPLCCVSQRKNCKEQFINKAKQIHSNIYDYSKVK